MSEPSSGVVRGAQVSAPREVEVGIDERESLAWVDGTAV
jgi:hypothetical protein